MKRACFLAAACVLAAGNGYVACLADPPHCLDDPPEVVYKIIELGVPDECTGVVDVRAFGINNRAQVVGQVICAGSPDVSYGFVWFPIRPSHGHPHLEIVLLDTTGSNTDSSANDLNDRAFVVGWQGEGSTSPEDAVFWDLSDANLEPTSIPPPDDEDMVEAIGINDKSTFQVVGWYLDGSDARGFVWTDGDNSSTSLNPAPDEGAGQWDDAMALAINNDSNALIGGTSGVILGNPNVSCTTAGGDATYWLKNGSQTGTELPQELFEENGKELAGEVRRINDADNLVGYGVECFNNSRLPRALYWESRTEEPINLGQLVMDIGDDADRSVANGITNDDDPVTIVGMNATDNFAVVWNALVADPEDEDDFCIIDVNDAIDQSTEWSQLVEATDINDDGWIVGYGMYDDEVRAFLLIPAPQACVGDTNDDGVVDVEDLVNVVLDWNTDGSSNGGDVDGSGIVNVLDLVVVVLNWGLCPGQSGSPPDSLETVLQSVGLSWDDWDEFVDNIGDENYRCWMGHYLNGECCFSCPTCPPDCPDDDPFGGH